MSSKHSVAEKLCLTCGLCCNGVIFADVQLQPEDDAIRMQSLGLPLRNLLKQRSGKTSSADSNVAKCTSKFSQPCVAFDGCRCRIYAERPGHCRNFDCALLKNVNEGEVKIVDALKTIEKAHRRAGKVLRLLRTLEDTDEHLPLAMRFRRTSKRLEGNDCRADASSFSELTLAFHSLNVLLCEKFYPGRTES